MSNQLSVDQQQTILALYQRGWSRRRIARELGLHRDTVARCVSLATDSKPAISTPGSEELGSKPAISTAGKSGRISLCSEHAALITERFNLGLSAQRIYQDLKLEIAFRGSYQSVKRFVCRLKRSDPHRVYRIECQPGEEVQVDFGLGAPLVDSQGKRRRTWVLRLVLSYSRKAYSEAVLRQTTEQFIRCLENAFRFFGGVTQTINLDNLKAAVLKADWYDPELNPKLVSFCVHYGTNLMPCRPRTPEHKGKCESGVKYVKTNALAGREFVSLAAQNQFLLHWEATVADLRIHGTTRKQVAGLFAEEKPSLLALPPSLFECFEEGRRTVHRDSYVEVAKAYYAVPEEYIGALVWVRWDLRKVRIFNPRWEQIQIYSRLEPGQFSHTLGIGGGRGRLLDNLQYWLDRAGELGGPCSLWAKSLVENRGPEAIRSLMGLVGLTQKHSFKAVNQACATAAIQGTYRLRDVRRLIEHPSPQGELDFISDHPLIRNLREYGLFIQTQTHE